MSLQLIWKRLITQVPVSSLRLSIPFLLLPPLAINSKPHRKIAKFCTETTTPFPAPPDRAVVTDFLINKCGMTEKDVSKAFKNRSSKGLFYKSTQDLEERLELLNECGLTTPAQIRKAVNYNPRVLLCISESVLKSRLSFLRFFMKEDDICKLIYRNSTVLNLTEDRLRSVISLLQRLGFEGGALSKLVAWQSRLLTSKEERIIETFKVLEGLGIEKGSQLFLHALRGMFGVVKEKLDLKLQCLSSLGFSEKQISKLSSRNPWILGLSEKKLRRNVEFLVKSAGFSLDDLMGYSKSFTCSLEKRIIPRYRVIEALKHMKVLETERISLYTLIDMAEKRFLEKYVTCNAESSSALRDIYYGGTAGIVDN